MKNTGDTSSSKREKGVWPLDPGINRAAIYERLPETYPRFTLIFGAGVAVPRTVKNQQVGERTAGRRPTYFMLGMLITHANDAAIELPEATYLWRKDLVF